MKVIILTVPGLRVEGELDSGDFTRLTGGFGGLPTFLRLRDVACERDGRTSEYKELHISRQHIVSWRAADPDGQEALPEVPPATDR